MYPYLIQFLKSIFIPFSLSFLVGCSTGVRGYGELVHGGAVVPTKNAVGSKAQEAYELARASMLQEKKVQKDVLWVLHQFASADKELMTFVERSKDSVYKPHFVPGVFAGLPRLALPEDPGSGTSKFISYVQAAFGQPEERAMQWLQDYIASDEDGYVLTHQFLGLIWAEQAGLPLTKEMLTRKQELWQRVCEELQSLDSVDSVDIYMERVAIVLMYGQREDIDQNAVDQWIRQIVDLQLADGSWPLSKIRISYDGESTVVSSPRSHTTALAMMALHAYIHK